MSLKAWPNSSSQEAGQQPVAGAMAAPVGRLRLVDARAHDHVEMLLEQCSIMRGSARRVVGRITVDQHVDVGLDVGEHAAHDMALALAALAAHLAPASRATAAVRSVEFCRRR